MTMTMISEKNEQLEKVWKVYTEYKYSIADMAMFFNCSEKQIREQIAEATKLFGVAKPVPIVTKHKTLMPRIPALAPDQPAPSFKRPPAKYSNPDWKAEYEKKYKDV